MKQLIPIYKSFKERREIFKIPLTDIMDIGSTDIWKGDYKLIGYTETNNDKKYEIYTNGEDIFGVKASLSTSKIENNFDSSGATLFLFLLFGCLIHPAGWILMYGLIVEAFSVFLIIAIIHISLIVGCVVQSVVHNQVTETIAKTF